MVAKRSALLIIALSIVTFRVVSAQDFVVDSLMFRSSIYTNPAELLRGQVSGVRVSATDGSPFGDMNINIRGVNSIHTSNRPLWIVDGVMVSQSITDNADAFWQYGELSYTSKLSPLTFLNPSEIESIQVLKNTTATSLYGTNGANGVIVVNTKQNRHSGRQVNIDSNIGTVFGNSESNIVHNHYLSFSGAGNNTSYNISGTFRDAKGILSGCDSKSGSLKVNFRTNSNKRISYGFNSIMSLGTYGVVPTTAYVGHLLNDISGYDDDSRNYRVLTSVFSQLNILPCLYFRVNGGLDLQYDRRIIYYDKSTEFGAVSEDNPNGGRASNMMSALINYNTDAELVFNRTFSNDHELIVRASAQLLGAHEKFNTMNGYNFPIDVLRGKSLNVGTYPIEIRRFNIDHIRTGLLSFASYNYKSLVGAEVSFRADCTQRYQGYAWQYYPSANLYVDLKNLLLRRLDVLSAFRIEGGYGESGYEKILPYELIGNALTGNWYKPEDGTEPFYDGVTRLRTREAHVGASVAVLNGRLIMSATYYDRETHDDFMMFQLGEKVSDDKWQLGGCKQVYERPAVINNSGVELMLKTQIINKRKFNWDLSANFTFGKTHFSSITSDDNVGMYIGSGYYTDVANIVSASPSCYGGLQSVLSLNGFALEAMIDAAGGNRLINLRKSSAGINTQSEKADYLRIGHIGFCYDIPLRKSFLKKLSVRLSGHNLLMLSDYSGMNPDINSYGYRAMGLDYGAYPVTRTIMFGVNARF